jgi:hypothetical protein
MSPILEQRRHRRHAAQLAATAVLNDGLVRRTTTIVNMSGGGAMLELPDSAPLTESVVLLYGHSIEACTVVWQEDRRAGVRFDAPLIEEAA